ncbi:MAG: RHS repeat-associated core domain-containing protein [Planctomycetota bacterium]
MANGAITTAARHRPYHFRKVYEHNGVREERLYLGGCEVYRKSLTSTGVVQDERETVHLSDDHRRVCMAETKTVTGASPVGSPTTYLRYQLDNHLGTCAVEVEADGAVVSYEEYHPYGTSAYRAQRGTLDVSAKRYRYTGKERDEETGLYYHGARYYAPWLGRWTAADPLAFADGTGGYTYARNEPTNLSDPNGRQVPGNAEQLAQYPHLKRILDEATETTLPLNPVPYTVTPPPNDAPTSQQLGLRYEDLPGSQVEGWEGVDRSPFILTGETNSETSTTPSLFKVGFNFLATTAAAPLTSIIAASSPYSPSIQQANDAFRLQYSETERDAGLQAEAYLGVAAALFGAGWGFFSAARGGTALLGRSMLIGETASGSSAAGTTSRLKWFSFWADQGGETTLSNYGLKYQGRLSFLNRLGLRQGYQASIINDDLKAGRSWFAIQDTKWHENFHALVGRHVPSITRAGDFRAGSVPLGAPVKFLEETAAYAVGHASALRLHAVPLAPVEAFVTLEAGEMAVTVGTGAAVGGGFYLWQGSSY